MRTRATAKPGGSVDETASTSSTPLDTSRWLAEPSSLEDLESRWIPATQAVLLGWLTEARDKTLRISEIKACNQHTESLSNALKSWTGRADLETGEFSDNIQAEFSAAIKPIEDAAAKTHQELRTMDSHNEYRYAQQAWEDFFYFQNEWNRRGHVRNARNHETATEAEAARRKDSKRKSDGRSAKTSIEDLYQKWRYYLILRYRDFGLGNRESVPDIVSLENAHRYSQRPRSTASPKLKSSTNRYTHLEQKFPGRREPLDKSNRTEVVSDKQAAISNERSKAGPDWNLEPEPSPDQANQTDQSHMSSSSPTSLLPVGHVPHHGALESSFDWPTSFDAQEWGNVVAVTASRRTYIHEQEEYELKNGEKKLRDKRDRQGRRTRLKEACGYKKVKRKRAVPVWIHELNEDGSVKGRDRTGRWIGKPGTADEFIDVHDPQYAKPVPDVRWRSKNVFKTVVIDSKWPRITRRERHYQAGNDAKGEAIVDQLSDDEAPDCIKYNMNFCYSGNATDISKAVQNDPDGEHVNSDNDSDDEGDLFTTSYLECSGPICRHAQALLLELRDEYGEASPKWTYHDIVALVDAEATDAEAAKIYREIVEAPDTRKHNSMELVGAARQLLAWEGEFGQTSWTVAGTVELLSKNPEMADLSNRYRIEAKRAAARAVELFGTLQEVHGAADYTTADVAEEMRAGKAVDVITDKYKDLAQLRVEITNKHQSQTSLTPEERGEGGSGFVA